MLFIVTGVEALDDAQLTGAAIASIGVYKVLNVASGTVEIGRAHV